MEGKGHSERPVFVKKAQKSRGSLWPVLPRSRGSPVWLVLPALGVPTQGGTPPLRLLLGRRSPFPYAHRRSEEHTSELQSHSDLVCRLLLEKKKAGLHTLSVDMSSVAGGWHLLVATR